MRRWGYGLAGLLAIALFAGLANPEEQPVTPETTASQSQAAEETTGPMESEATTGDTSPTVDPEPSPSQTGTETSEPASEESPTPDGTTEPTPSATPTPTQTAAAPEPQTSGLAALYRS